MSTAPPLVSPGCSERLVGPAPSGADGWFRSRCLPLRATAPVVLLALVSVALGCANLKIHDADPWGVKIAKGIVRVPLAIVTVGTSERIFALDRTLASWLGQPVDRLMLAWGVPQRVIPDGGAGGCLVFYTEHRARLNPGSATSTTTASASGYTAGGLTNLYGESETRTTYTPATVQTWEVYRSFRINPNGIVVEYSWRGL